MKEPDEQNKPGKQGISSSIYEKELRAVRQDELTGVTLPDEKKIKPLAIITWEDITAYARVELPEDFEKYRLIKKTVGFVWSESDEYLVLVQDYDLTNRGKKFKHNDFHIIPKGVIKEIRYLGTEKI